MIDADTFGTASRRIEKHVVPAANASIRAVVPKPDVIVQGRREFRLYSRGEDLASGRTRLCHVQCCLDAAR